MFCTKCGKEIHDGDIYCANCGAKVRESETPKYEEVVFNPPFKIEAEKKTREIATQIEDNKKRTQERVKFDWNLDGFPTKSPKPTEEANFNWESVVERRNNVREKEIEVEKIPTAEKIKPEAVIKNDFTVDDLQREFFGEEKEKTPEVKRFTNISSSDEKFYTFSQKQNEFQELVEKEYAKLKSMEGDISKEQVPDIKPPEDIEPPETIETLENIDSPEIIEEPEVIELPEVIETPDEAEMPVEVEKVEEEEQQQTEEVEHTKIFEIFHPEKKQEVHVTEPEPEFVGVSEPELPLIVEAYGEEKVPETEEPPTVTEDASPETEKVMEEEKSSPPIEREKLRYSDIFPNELVDGDDSLDNDTDDKAEETEATEAEEPKKKKGILAKIVIALLIIMIIMEAFVIVVRFVAPESSFSKKANETIIGIIEKFKGENSATEEDPVVSVENANTYVMGIIEKYRGDIETIGEISEDSSLCYDISKDYAFDEISESATFVDADWYEDKEGNKVTYVDAIIKSLLHYYDGWQETNKDKSLVGINKLEIGEIRAGDKCFYALCRVTYAGEDGSDVVKYQSVLLKEGKDAISVDTIKEETL